MPSAKYIAGIIAVLALMWIGSGFLFPSAEPSQGDAQTESHKDGDKPMEVRYRDLTAEEFKDEVVLTGRTQASRKVELQAETSGQIADLLKEKGDDVQKGETLAKIEMRDRLARLNETKERVSQREIEYNAAQSLEERGFNSRVRLAQARADLENARAERKAAEVELAKINIKAPFDGVIYIQSIEEGDFVAIGDPIFTVVDLDPVEMVGFVSENNVGKLQTGQSAVAEFLDGQVVEGTVSFVAPAANEQTRTFRVEVSAPNDAYQVKEGLTAKIRIPVESKMAHKISPSILALDDSGRVGVKIVDENDIARFVPVRILSDRPEYMWIGGLPEQVRLITVGQDFVADGQKVTPVEASEEGLL